MSDFLRALGITFCSPQFGDSFSAMEWQRKRRDAEMRATVPFSVAIGCSVSLGGQTFKAGDAIPATDPTIIAALRQLAQRGAIIAVDAQDVELRKGRGDVERSRHRVRIDGRQVLQAPSGRVFLDGEPIAAADVTSTNDKDGEATLAGFVDRGLIVDAKAKAAK